VSITTTELLTFGVGADTSSAEASLASLGSTADGVAVGLEDRLSGASDELKNMGKASTGAGRGFTGLAAAISVVDPKLGAAVRQVGSLARGLTLLRAVSGPVAIGIGVVTAALATYNAAQQISNERAERARERAERLTEALRAQAEATSDLQTETDLITGATDRYRLSAEEQIEQQKQLGAEARAAMFSQMSKKHCHGLFSETRKRARRRGSRPTGSRARWPTLSSKSKKATRPSEKTSAK
jgi:hypothetical protein